ncbi:hypothetical protein [uncultured Treponema sp.]|uniref:DUF7723 family protein n=1 Tax=uncultured Treponema sp. TaxID=162155 RepID=UPI0025F111B0|nr:hypothetical protein [uncultured Treponema sp.]
MLDVTKIADEADVIISGFAVKKKEDGFYVYNLNNAEGVALFTKDEILVETNMDDIELAMAQKTLTEGKKYIGAEQNA